ncbi:MAG: alpha-L-glutamate ligase [Pseudomonadota bacterium]
MPLDATSADEPKVFVIHENDEWVEPLRTAFGALGTPFEEWHLRDGLVDLTQSPPEGVFYNRMSASSHTRGHRYAPELAGATLAWLKAHGRTVVNGERALQLEVSKVAQYQALRAFDIRTPGTIAAVGQDLIREAAGRLGFPLIFKHNRAGKGLGVQLLRSQDALQEHLASPAFTQSIDGITLVQRYIEAPEPFITRVEFVGGKFLYAVRVDTSDGFELCPADVCQLGDDTAVCAAPQSQNKFDIVEGFNDPLIPLWEKFLAANDIQIAGIEFIVDGQGNAFTYDVNTNTNYNPLAEAKVGMSGMGAIAGYLTGLLNEQYVLSGRVAA